MTAVDQALPALGKSSPGPELLKPQRRVAAYDGLRAFAVLLVVVGHAGFQFHGFIGVDIFFVLSGFLITSILLDELSKTGRLGFGNFYMRRVLRLIPALLLLLTLYLTVSAILKYPMKIAFGDSAIVLVYIANWVHMFSPRPNYLAHCWSLSIEEQFYLLWPVIVLGLYLLLGRTWKAALVCLLAACAIVCYRHWMDPIAIVDPANKAAMARFYRIYFGLDTHGDDLLAGAALGFWVPRLPRFPAALLGWAGLLLTIAYVLVTAADSSHSHNYLWGLNIPVPRSFGNFGPYPYAYIWAFMLAVLIGLLNDPNGLMARLLSLKPLAWIGMISYGLYLYHYPIVILSAERLLKMDPSRSRWIILAVEVPLAFLIATISFYALERPCLRLKDRFRPAKPLAKP